MALTTGQIVNQRYRIARLLGKGGMGAVYRAWDLTLNIPVALKELIPDPTMDARTLAELRAQFQREAQVLASLSHPNLTRVTDFFEWGGNAYLVMDFVEGENLHQLIERQGALPEEQVIGWALQLLDALHTCHARNVLHRDIKPQNIIIRATDGRAVLVDFGLVKLWDPHRPQTQNIIRGMGTPEYASPEHFGLSGQHTQPCSDLYSLGATLYHALTGREPPSALERWANPNVLVPPRALGLRVSPAVEATLLRALALPPTERFASAVEMLGALQGSVATVPFSQPLLVAPAGGYVAPEVRPTAVRPLALTRDTRWPLELGTALGMALVGMLALQTLLFSAETPAGQYLGLSVGALLLGGIGWFGGDLIFQAVAQRARGTAGAPASNRPTQRLVAFTQRLTRRMTTGQQVGLLAALVAVAVGAAWLLGPVVAKVPWLWRNLPSYAFAGPLAYAAVGRRPGRALAAHVLVASLGGLALQASTGSTVTGLPALLGAALAGGLLMEGLAWVAGRTWLKG